MTVQRAKNQRMVEFTKLELASLHAIFSETPALAQKLEHQLQRSAVTKRENTGGGFFTDIAVADDAPKVDCPDVLGHTTHARIGGLKHGLGFVLFMEEGKLHLLEGYALGESTASVDLINLSFEIFHEPLNAVKRLD